MQKACKPDIKTGSWGFLTEVLRVGRRDSAERISWGTTDVEGSPHESPEALDGQIAAAVAWRCPTGAPPESRGRYCGKPNEPQ